MGDVLLKCKNRITERTGQEQRLSPPTLAATVPILSVVAKSVGWGVVVKETGTIEPDSA